MLEMICKWRTELMGVAILWIVLFHSQMQLGNILGLIQKIGYGGVDIFLLLSGVGIYYSLQKQDGLANFYKRRCLRIFPSYLPFIIVWCVWKLKPLGISVIEKAQLAFGNICMTGWINGLEYQFNWYVQVICWFYFIAPILYQLISACKKRWHYIALFLGFASIGFPFFFDLVHLMGAARLPIFVLGMMWAHLEHMVKGQEKNMKGTGWGWMCLTLGNFVIGTILLLLCIYRYEETLWAYGTWWYPFLLITPGLCFLLSMLMEFAGKFKLGRILLKILKWLGTASFEIYLLHIALFDAAPGYMWLGRNLQWAKLILLALAVGVIYHFLVEMIRKGIYMLCRNRRSI